MKILIACIPNPMNSYMADLVEGLSTFAEVTWDFNEFWNCNANYDVVHIHWPEYLSFEIESYLNTTDPLPDDLWNRLRKCLEHWQKQSTIVYTRHVRAPHKRDDVEFTRLYQTVFEYCIGMSHFAKFSIEQYKDYFPSIETSLHVVIPQHNHVSLPNTSNKQSARKELKIDKDANVLMCFGLVKENEKLLINQAYQAIPGTNKMLLAPGWKIQKRNVGYIRLREWILKFENWLVKQNQSKRINLGFIPDERAHLYCNAADVLLIPRTNELFSGNISLAFTFGLVVVGKNDSNIGEILMNYDNPTFEVGNEDSLNEAITKAFALAEQGHGEKNRRIALEKWSIQSIANSYEMFYEKAIKLKTQVIS